MADINLVIKLVMVVFFYFCISSSFLPNPDHLFTLVCNISSTKWGFCVERKNKEKKINNLELNRHCSFLFFFFSHCFISQSCNVLEDKKWRKWIKEKDNIRRREGSAKRKRKKNRDTVRKVPFQCITQEFLSIYDFVKQKDFIFA